jgi:hypothetical protein
VQAHAKGSAVRRRRLPEGWHPCPGTDSGLDVEPTRKGSCTRTHICRKCQFARRAHTCTRSNKGRPLPLTRMLSSKAFARTRSCQSTCPVAHTTHHRSPPHPLCKRCSAGEDAERADSQAEQALPSKPGRSHRVTSPPTHRCNAWA